MLLIVNGERVIDSTNIFVFEHALSFSHSIPLIDVTAGLVTFIVIIES